MELSSISTPNPPPSSPYKRFNFLWYTARSGAFSQLSSKKWIKDQLVYSYLCHILWSFAFRVVWKRSMMKWQDIRCQRKQRNCLGQHEPWALPGYILHFLCVFLLIVFLYFSRLWSLPASQLASSHIPSAPQPKWVFSKSIWRILRIKYFLWLFLISISFFIPRQLSPRYSPL